MIRLLLDLYLVTLMLVEILLKLIYIKKSLLKGKLFLNNLNNFYSAAGAKERLACVHDTSFPSLI